MNYFERFEKKFLITLNQKEKIKNKFNNIFKSEFKNGYSCYSLYFDDLNFSTLKQKSRCFWSFYFIEIIRGVFQNWIWLFSALSKRLLIICHSLSFLVKKRN